MKSATNKSANRVTVTFQPTERALKLLMLADRTPMTRSEMINEAIEKHLPHMLKEQVGQIEKLLQDLKKA